MHIKLDKQIGLFLKCYFLGTEPDEKNQIDILEDKLKEIIDLTSQKSANGRVTSFESLCKAFSSKHMPDFVAGRRMTLMDCAERGLKKGRGAEQEAAAKLLALLCLQLGSIDDGESIFKDQKIYLLTLIADHSMAPAARAQVELNFILSKVNEIAKYFLHLGLSNFGSVCVFGGLRDSRNSADNDRARKHSLLSHGSLFFP